jgi:hypothetical protein
VCVRPCGHLCACSCRQLRLRLSCIVRSALPFRASGVPTTSRLTTHDDIVTRQRGVLVSLYDLCANSGNLMITKEVLHSTASDQSTNQASSRVKMSRWLSIPCAVIVATATLMLAPGLAHSSDTVSDPTSGQKSRDQLQKRADATSFDGGTGQLRIVPRDGQPLHQQRPDATSSEGSADHDRWPSEVAMKRASVFTEFERRVRPSPPPRTAACPHVLTAC